MDLAESHRELSFQSVEIPLQVSPKIYKKTRPLEKNPIFQETEIRLFTL